MKKYEVVYNGDHGGFGLSTKAVSMILGHTGVPSTPEEDFIYEIPRHHPRLILAVKDLGKDANGPCADLRIEVIDGPIYRIHSYEGLETVLTPEDGWVCIEGNAH